MRFLVLLALALVAGCSGCASLPESGKGAVTLVMQQGRCSGTAVGRHTILTAAHCFSARSGEMAVDGVDVRYSVLAEDGRDHVLVWVSKRQVRYSRIAKMPRPGSRISMLGNPHGLPDLWRDGVYAGEMTATSCPAFSSDTPCKLLMLDLNGTEGDSGAGIFDAQGRLVAVLSGGLRIPERSGGLWGMPFALALGFTDKQLELVI